MFANYSVACSTYSSRGYKTALVVDLLVVVADNEFGQAVAFWKENRMFLVIIHVGSSWTASNSGNYLFVHEWIQTIQI
jgi:hypothetical protein